MDLPAINWLLSRWPGRVVLRTVATSVRIEIFDRSMTIAAQFFTSVFPIVILIASWVGASETKQLADALDMPDQSQAVLQDALSGSDSATFGIIGTLIVLISATSLSRALNRAFAAIWELPRPKSRLRSAWRWLAVVLAFALSLVVVRALTVAAERVPPANLWQVLTSVACDMGIMVVVPWLLLSGAVPPRRLVPGALIFAIVMIFGRPASAAYLPRALEVSAHRYGSFGVAFTYLAWLYVVSFALLLTSIVGQVITTERGWLGTWIRGTPTETTDAT